LERTLDRMRVSLEDPLLLARLAAGLLLTFGTVVAVVFWLAADDSRFLKLVAGLWSVYGFTVGVVNGLLTPLIDGAGRALQGFGARRGRPDYASIEALEAGGHYALAVERYREARAGATLSRNDDLRIGLALMNLYEHHLAEPGLAMAELSRLAEQYAGTPYGGTLSRMLKARTTRELPSG
jgi:hypothetical protein